MRADPEIASAVRGNCSNISVLLAFWKLMALAKQVSVVPLRARRCFNGDLLNHIYFACENIYEYYEISGATTIYIKLCGNFNQHQKKQAGGSGMSPCDYSKLAQAAKPIAYRYSSL